MGASPTTIEAVLRMSPRIQVLPILHGSGDVAQEVRETLISHPVDCLAVPLPPSVEECVESAIHALPRISLVVQPEPDRGEGPACNFVPVDPCQAVIMGIRVAMGERIPRAYVDLEVPRFEPLPFAVPDPYALKRVSLAAFAAGLLPALPWPSVPSQRADRIAWMAFRLHELELEYERVLCLCPLADWPWLRAAFQERKPYPDPERPAGPAAVYRVNPDSLYFVLGELPFITALYERRRAELRPDRHLSVDGIKELLLEARSQWLAHRHTETRSVPNWVTPHLLQLALQYVRNLALLDRRLTPDLYALVLAMKQTAGDEFALTVLETAKTYAFQAPDTEAPEIGRSWPELSAGIGKLELPGGDVVEATTRLQGPPLVWRSLALSPKPTRPQSRSWALQWNPFRQCSWAPEDTRIESFTGHVREQARAILGADLARIEKFTTSVKDGIDLRETLRHWPQGLAPAKPVPVPLPPSTGTVSSSVAAKSNGVPASRVTGPRKRESPRASPRRMDIYVREIPPARGLVEVVVFLFETPADPVTYRWRATWYAEHAQESTLSFFATPFQEDMTGPGIARARYGGTMFLFPPRPIPNIWEDRRLAFTRTLEERLLAAASLHSREPHIALVSPVAPRAAWRRIARRFQRHLVVIPLSRFSGQTVERLRHFHVLNGQEVRSYAAQFIRE